MSTNAETVSAAIVAYTGWGKAKTPRADAAAVGVIARETGMQPEALLEEVLTAVATSENIDLGGADLQSAEAGPAYKARLRDARPDFTQAAIDALASRWFFRRLWLGADTPRVPADAPIRYFTLFALREGERVPRALFRRRTVAGEPVDEVLRDTDVWAPDESQRVMKAITRYIDSDLEEISPARAEEFLRMVAARDYRPFRAP